MELIKGCKNYFPPTFNSFHTWQQPCESRVRYDVGGTKYGEVRSRLPPKSDLTIRVTPLKNHSILQYNASLASKFSSPAARLKGLRLGASPESATLAVTIIPVSPAVGVKTPGSARLRPPPPVGVRYDTGGAKYGGSMCHRFGPGSL